MKRILLAACLVALCRTAEAQQVIVGNSVSAPYLTGTNFGKKSIGFLVGATDVYLTDIQVALGGQSAGGGTVTFTLNADANGLPGTVIATIGSATVTGFVATVPFTITPAFPLPLNAATTYWIQAVFGTAQANWDQNNPKIAPTSPSGLATFLRYIFEDGVNPPVVSGTFNAIVVEGSATPPPAATSGSAARAILTGSSKFGSITPIDVMKGGFTIDVNSSAIYDHVGWSDAATLLPITGPRVGAYVTTADCTSSSCNSIAGIGEGGSRAIAYAEYNNPASNAVTVSASAALDGQFPQGLGHATAAVYVFDKTDFLNTIPSNGANLAAFLLGSDDLGRYRSASQSNLSLTRLFPSVIASEFLNVDSNNFVTGMTVGPPAVSVAAHQSVIVVFDISAYAPPGVTVQFIKTLKPAAGFMTGMTAVGPWVPDPPAAANIALAPVATTNPVTTPVTVTATVTAAGGAAVPNTIVFFDMASGPNAQTLGPAMTDANGRASFTYAGGPDAGTDVIHATIDTLQSNAAAVTWTIPGPLDHIAIAPASATIGSGGSQTYTAQSLDVFDHAIGDVTANTTFAIAPDGSCTGATCTATIAGPHTVTGTNGTLTATATLNVNSQTFTFHGFFQPIDMSTANLVVWNGVKAGQAVPIKWVLMLNGAPVSDPTSFAGVSSYPIACLSGAGSIDDAIDQTATGNSGLQYNGDGNWQFNWQTLTSYKNTCRAVVVKFSDGTTSPAALFKFR